MMTIRCTHCGTTNRAGSNFCNHCGAELRPGEGETFSASQPPAAPVQGSEVDEHGAGREPSLDPLTASQPWLRPEHVSGEETPLAEEHPVGAKRLAGPVQGLLEPLRVLSDASEEDLLAAALPAVSPAPPLSADRVRRLRSLMAEEPILIDEATPYLRRHSPWLQMPWLFLFVGLLIGLPVFLLVPDPPPGEVHTWPGVEEAHTVVQSLSPSDLVLLLWAYDPSTSGEMDRVALPIVVDLLRRQTQLLVVSQLPNGPATARRLVAQAVAATGEGAGLGLAAVDEQLRVASFLPGGVGALPLLGVNLAEGVYSRPGENATALAQVTAQTPALAVVIAAYAEDVQEWLEQVQPLNGAPVVAFSSAGADPLVRPYLASGQLAGLVSGFDGAQAYIDLQQRDGVVYTTAEETRVRRHRIFQNWGHIALLIAIVLGNLAALLGKRGDDKQ
jgi:hypothetical protein